MFAESKDDEDEDEDDDEDEKENMRDEEEIRKGDMQGPWGKLRVSLV